MESKDTPPQEIEQSGSQQHQDTETKTIENDNSDQQKQQLPQEDGRKEETGEGPMDIEEENQECLMKESDNKHKNKTILITDTEIKERQQLAPKEEEEETELQKLQRQLTQTQKGQRQAQLHADRTKKKFIKSRISYEKAQIHLNQVTSELHLLEKMVENKVFEDCHIQLAKQLQTRQVEPLYTDVLCGPNAARSHAGNQWFYNQVRTQKQECTKLTSRDARLQFAMDNIVTPVRSRGGRFLARREALQKNGEEEWVELSLEDAALRSRRALERNDQEETLKKQKSNHHGANDTNTNNEQDNSSLLSTPIPDQISHVENCTNNKHDHIALTTTGVTTGETQIEEITTNDVLTCKLFNAKSKEHKGNQDYFTLLQKLLPKYHQPSTTPNDRKMIRQELIAKIEESGGRFLWKRSPGEKFWRQLTQEEIAKKVQQAFWDASRKGKSGKVNAMLVRSPAK